MPDSRPYEIAAILAFLNACREEYSQSFKRQAFKEQQYEAELRYAAEKVARTRPSAPKASMIPIPDLLPTCPAWNTSTALTTDTMLGGLDTTAAYDGSSRARTASILLGVLLFNTIIFLIVMAAVYRPQIFSRAKHLVSRHSRNLFTSFISVISVLFMLLDWYLQMKAAAVEYIMRFLEGCFHKTAEIISYTYGLLKRTLAGSQHWKGFTIINKYWRMKASAAQCIMRLPNAGLDKSIQGISYLYGLPKRTFVSPQHWKAFTTINRYWRMKGAAAQYMIRVLDAGFHKTTKVISCCYDLLKRTLASSQHWIGFTIISRKEAAEWRAQMETQISEVLSLKADKETSEAEMVILKDQLEEAESERDAAKAKVTKLETDQTDQIRRLNEDHNAKLAEADTKHATNIKTLNDAHTTEIGELRSQRDARIEESKKLADEMQTLTSSLDSANTTITTLNEEHRTELSKAQSERDAATEESKKLADETQTLTSSLDAANTTINTLKEEHQTELSKAQSERAAATEESKKQGKEIDILWNCIGTHETKNTQLGTDLKSAKDKTDAQAKEINNLITRLASAEATNILLREDHSAEVTKIHADHRRYESDYEEAYQEGVNRLKALHEAELVNLKDEHATELSRLREELPPQLPEPGNEEAGDHPIPPSETGAEETGSKLRKRKKRNHNPNGMNRDQRITHLKTMAPSHSKSGNRAHFKNMDYEVLADMTEGWSGLEIQEAVARAKRIESGEADGRGDPRLIYHVDQSHIVAQILEMGKEGVPKGNADAENDGNGESSSNAPGDFSIRGAASKPDGAATNSPSPNAPPTKTPSPKTPTPTLRYDPARGGFINPDGTMLNARPFGPPPLPTTPPPNDRSPSPPPSENVPPHLRPYVKLPPANTPPPSSS